MTRTQAQVFSFQGSRLAAASIYFAAWKQPLILFPARVPAPPTVSAASSGSFVWELHRRHVAVDCWTQGSPQEFTCTPFSKKRAVLPRKNKCRSRNMPHFSSVNLPSLTLLHVDVDLPTCPQPLQPEPDRETVTHGPKNSRSGLLLKVQAGGTTLVISNFARTSYHRRCTCWPSSFKPHCAGHLPTHFTGGNRAKGPNFSLGSLRAQCLGLRRLWGAGFRVQSLGFGRVGVGNQIQP